MIPYGRQYITQDDIDSVVNVLKSDFITQGPYVERFENEIAKYCNVKYAVAVNSCTAGLHITYAALGLDKGKLLWTVPNTFVATANAALYCNADVDFVDIDPNTYLMCMKALSEKLKTAKRVGKLPDIVAPVHFAGQSCDMEELQRLSQIYGFKIVEDAAHCIGASYKNNKVGSCEFSSAAVFSFHPVKIITTGEGGVITTNDEALYKSLLKLRTHGITKSPEDLNNNPEPWYFEQQDLGYHYRITDIQCAMGISQMKRLDDYVAKRIELVKRYNDKLKKLPLILPTLKKECYSSWHLYVIQLKQNNKSRLDVFKQLRVKGIGVNVHYIPVHIHPYYKKLGFRQGDYPVSESYYDNAITLPLYPALTDAEQDHVCKSLEEVLKDA